MTRIEGITSLVGEVVGGKGNVSHATETVGVSPFAGLFKDLVHETADLSKKAEHAVAGLLSGSGIDVHEAMVSTQKADIAFEFALQVRNKAVGAYQQMMGMQF